MFKIATIDRQPGSEIVAVWLTYRTDLNADHGNAVVIDTANDPDAMEKVRSLTRSAAVLITDGTVLDGLPIEGEPLTVSDITALLTEVEATERSILDAITAYKKRTRSSSLIEPTFPSAPSVDRLKPERDDAPARALATADYMRRVWSVWLRTDEERRRRTIQPRTGQTPWIMPDSMNAPTVSDFPTGFASHLHQQALV